MDRLRDPVSGCPWDRQQTFATIVPHTLEEAYEVADVIESGRYDALAGELGDLLFQIVFYARLAKERGWFSFDSVVEATCEKLVARHPHVFAGAAVGDAGEQSRRWEAIKARERSAGNAGAGTLGGIALALPAITRAAKLQRRAAQVGFDWPEAGPVFEKVLEELGEVRDSLGQGRERMVAEVGDLLFACINLARHLDVEPEQALRGANTRFERRFGHIERNLANQGKAIAEATASEMEALWEDAKRGDGGA
ncbi:MAG: Nucleoside triphosphate pyrophosphohydrolase [Gammaproteobacteria bacterium]|nr:Nucleoside triphosphate pyrophosphohydrolase [Gammaproteobacteria bacterium]